MMKKNLLSLVGTIALATSLQAQEAGVTQVLDFLPAPGQYTNVLPLYEEGDTKEDMLAKCLANINKGTYVCLGGYGGYITLGFDHTIPNVEGEYDLSVTGNAFSGSSEPGIVLVAVDANNNGIADDEWYELAGSEYNNPDTKKSYTLTYYKPTETSAPIAWSNSEGETGENAFLSCFIAPTNDSNYPKWITDETISFTGTRLPDNSLATYDWGYADNQPNDTDEAKFKIDWAVDAEGNPVALEGIDFVKIYSAVEQINGAFGECSTEVINVLDLHPLAATFENIDLEPESYNNGATTSFFEQYEAGTLEVNGWGYSYLDSQIASGSYLFLNTYNYSAYGSYWGGVAFSNQTSTTYEDMYTYPEQEFNSAAGGAATGETFAVCNGEITITLADNVAPHTLQGVNITNSAYAIHSMTNGDNYAKKFEEGDYFLLTITGYNGTEATGTVEFYLADYRSTEANDHYMVTDWRWVDLSSLGDITTLTWTLSSTDNDDWGYMNTPAYFCIDDLNGEPVQKDEALVALTTATFEDTALASESYCEGGTEAFYQQYDEGTLPVNSWGYSYLDSQRASGSYLFPNSFAYNVSYGSYWSGVAFSTLTETTFEDIYTYPEQQFNSAAGGAATGETFAVCNGEITITLADNVAPHTLQGVNITNSAYAIHSMTNGDNYAKKFEEGDYFLLTITGYNGTEATGTVEFYLADYRSTEANDHYMVTDWRWVDLSSLGDITTLTWTLSSTDNDDWGYMNTPAYFCIDDLNSEKPITSAVAPTLSSTTPTLAVYPAVATDAINVLLPSSDGGKVNIYSAQGKLVWSEQCNTQQTTIQLATLTSGVYIITVESTEGITSSRFVKR